MNFKILYEKGRTFLHYRRPIITKFLDDVAPNSTLLDLGCGTGHWLNHLRNDLGFKIIGIDYSKDSIYSIRNSQHEFDSNTDFLIGDARSPPLKSESFSGLFSSDLFRSNTPQLAAWDKGLVTT